MSTSGRFATRVLLSGLLAAPTIAPAPAATRVELDVDTHVGAAADRPAPPDRHRSLVVTSSDDATVVESASGIVACDFAARKRVEAAVATFVAPRPLARTKGWVIGIFEANDRAKLGDPAAARKLFLDALDANPAMAGVSEDLGDVLLLQWDMARAWRAWDAGRAIAPRVANFAGVDRLESRLPSEQPDWF